MVLLQLYINTRWSSRHDGIGCHAPVLPISPSAQCSLWTSLSDFDKNVRINTVEVLISHIFVQRIWLCKQLFISSIIEKIKLFGLRHLTTKEKISAFDAEHTQCWTNKGVRVVKLGCEVRYTSGNCGQGPQWPYTGWGPTVMRMFSSWWTRNGSNSEKHDQKFIGPERHITNASTNFEVNPMHFVRKYAECYRPVRHHNICRHSVDTYRSHWFVTLQMLSSSIFDARHQ